MTNDDDQETTDRLLDDDDYFGLIVDTIPSLIDQLADPDEWLVASVAWASGVPVEVHHLGDGLWHYWLAGVPLPSIHLALGRGYR